MEMEEGGKEETSKSIFTYLSSMMSHVENMIVVD